MVINILLKGKKMLKIYLWFIDYINSIFNMNESIKEQEENLTIKIGEWMKGGK